MKSIGIYIHFPFCISKCKYCNFNSYTGKEQLQIDYLQALVKEIQMYSNKKIKVDSIYIGGGTPSVMFDGCITTLMTELKKSFDIDPDAEISIEANPNSVTSAKVREWKDCGINRVSVGLQSSNSSMLKLIGRVHTKQDYINAIETIKNNGIDNINTDILVGLPRQRMSYLKHTLRLVTKLKCNHVSVYSLILEEGTPLYEMVKNKQLICPSDDKTLNMYNFAYEFLRENGFNRYEVSNFAKRGYECKHNMNTWEMGEYLGFGAGAHSYYKNMRYNNVLTIEDYIEQLSLDKYPVEYSEKLSKQEKFEETIMLGLRTSQGVDLDKIKKNYGIDLIKSKKSTIDELMSLGLINLVYNRIVVSKEGFAVLNKIILDIVS